MNVVIVGQGSMGLLWYHHIQQLIKHNSEYNKVKLHLLPSYTSPSNDQYSITSHSNSTYRSIIHFAQTENIQAADIIIFCLKSFQIATALMKISDSLKGNANIILAHNGMGTLEKLPPSLLSKHNIYTLLTTHGSLRTAPLTITHTGVGTTDIGLLSGDTDLLEQQAITQLLSSALAPVTFHKQIEHKQWLKLAINCVINPLTAINDINNGQISNEKYALKIALLLSEITEVASAEGITLDLSELEKEVRAVAKATAKNSSSMRCDIAENRTSEIDYINGYICRLGIKHDIATPENNTMRQEVKKLAAKP